MKVLQFFRAAPFLLVLGALLAFAGPKLKKTAVTKNISVGVPEGFQPLPDDGIAAKYPSPRKPLAVFSNPNGRVDLSVAQKPTTFSNRDYALLLKVYKASIQNMYSKVEFLQEDIRTINKRDFIMLEFVSTVTDNRRGGNLAPIRKYQLVQYAIEGDQLFIFTFDAPAEEQRQWQPIAQEVMASINMK
ncbi:hypothetical protein HMJ29_10140 [Hymenobacter taeanensis]|uniref:DUF1795 domain-containing protein n=1 Tax=Hymenobacter taeanensis TaxID=2735321 RepID=A0A6M6BGC3_9BACT|nr:MULTISPECIES: hypothetical protein [Hymenobacter]QJX47277.1 hypothetical protein HMJ29_10140 [Hymenobacter taeanensis]UOQ79387.1 hypothetical protein MUN83_10990 [Hymenobacter sp. 5414T-23]